MKRTVLREHVFRILFRYDFYDKEGYEEQKALYFDAYPDLSEYPEIKDCPDISELDRAEIETRVDGLLSHIEEIDTRLGEACTGWRIERIGKAELAVLRLAVFEIVFDPEVDRAVAINEAVELARKYGDDKAPSFVNGVLSKI
ncbi:MAG: transcription antitermination factor NusB [Butyrivibrio sp.]